MKHAYRLRKILSVLVCGAFLASCSMFSGRETAGEYIDDTAITSKIKAEILKDPALKVLQINVETMQGVVQLSGFVDSSNSETKAMNIARHVNGVISVRNNLIVPMK